MWTPIYHNIWLIYILGGSIYPVHGWSIAMHPSPVDRKQDVSSESPKRHKHTHTDTHKHWTTFNQSLLEYDCSIIFGLQTEKPQCIWSVNLLSLPFLLFSFHNLVTEIREYKHAGINSKCQLYIERPKLTPGTLPAVREASSPPHRLAETFI